MSTAAPTVDAATLAQLMRADHADPFAVLGMHETPGGLVVRALLPQAEQVCVLDEAFRPCLDLVRQPGSDLFCGIVPQRLRPFAYQLQVRWHTDGGVSSPQVIDDAYRFGPQLGDTDIWLLAEGTHHRPFEQLGAHPLTVEGVAGTRFAVWAPNARRVSVVGAFNNWDGRRHMMRRRAEFAVWEIFVPHVGEGDVYKYEVLGHDEQVRLKADPVAFGGELRPQTASVVRALPASVTLPIARAAANALDAPISNLRGASGLLAPTRRRSLAQLPRNWRNNLVPYARDLGFTHIELLPVNEHPFDGSWGYQPVGLYAPTSRFGSPEDFKGVLSQQPMPRAWVSCWTGVPAHFPSDAHGLERFDGTAVYEYEDPPRRPSIKTGTTLIYNYGRTEVRNFLVGQCPVLAGALRHRRPARGRGGVHALSRLQPQERRVDPEPPRRAREPRSHRFSCAA